MAAATNYLRSVGERTTSSCVNSIFDIFLFDTFLLSSFFLSTKSMSFISFIYYEKNLKKLQDFSPLENAV
jgi:hypothetical protein